MTSTVSTRGSLSHGDLETRYGRNIGCLNERNPDEAWSIFNVLRLGRERGEGNG